MKKVSLGMMGPYELTTEKVDEVVTKTSPGNYALGYIDGESFIVRYVGRSDENVNIRLKQWARHREWYKRLGSDVYTHFMFSYAKSPKAAFEKECKNYHDCGGKEILDNERHPQRPDGTNWKCPMCDIFD